ncbi:DM13 domain-containing protein [Mammaliicoccus sciuri]|uniref:DM13 domain-containing protein n=1 Tax=Mammaliicoccus sciuri TaxID=1296 RepID=UPI0018B06299|nr:DM13 domain-containing protein [Mammaliicoccus sciuri]MBF9298177.1 DM13 domain-containing protein [Staphylococcus schleiferi]MCJ0943384.1 DM13 domain-containing protein [Mammaliicoccus sciuri]MCJ1785003.1 DM13 domain-containing protein [Mammaliicoccus sciuri]MDO0949234.1 DM13 domain-containing protein [Mammaliicoccus sciuri]MDO0954250.1 DM13 domain-containing protein [Mammaliicoccus sciuri]
MNLTKTTFGAFALTTTILLGACGNNDMQKDDKMDTKTEMKDKDMSKENMKDSEMKDMMMSGMFESMNGEKVEGKATIKDNKLMLTDFKSSKGPDLHVYLTKDGDIKKGMKIDKVDYDKMEQTFDLKDMDTSKYNEVTIYCDKAHVVFGSAKLK